MWIFVDSGGFLWILAGYSQLTTLAMATHKQAIQKLTCDGLMKSFKSVSVIVVLNDIGGFGRWAC